MMKTKQFQTKEPVTLYPDKWKICISNPFVNCEKIYPTQQKKVNELITALKTDESVKSITIFGSSTSERCHCGSDVDAYVALSQQGTKKPYLSFPCDFWTNFTVDKRMRDEIEKKGVIVYEKF